MRWPHGWTAVFWWLYILFPREVLQMKRFWQVWQDTWMLLWGLVCFLFPYALFFWAIYLLESGEWRGFFDNCGMGWEC